MVDGSNDASWHKGVSFGYVNDEKYIKGVYDPKNRRFFRPSREITAKTWMINNFQTVQFCHLLVMYDT